MAPRDNSPITVNDLVLKKILPLHEHYDFEDVNGTKLSETNGNLQVPAKFVVVDTRNN